MYVKPHLVVCQRRKNKPSVFVGGGEGLRRCNLYFCFENVQLRMHRVYYKGDLNGKGQEETITAAVDTERVYLGPEEEELTKFHPERGNRGFSLY